VGGLGLSTLFLLFPSLAIAAGPTLKAAKVGQKIVWRGYVYTVVSSKGKLVWKQGAKVAAASASASATPSSTPTPTPTPTPSATPTATPTPTPSATATKSAEPVASARPDLGVFIAFSNKLKEGDIAIFPARNSKGQLLNYALSRKSGVVKAFSTVCTHAGCVVQVNQVDLFCACHSSNFDAFSGKATGGPANDPLESYKASEADGAIYIKI
jgi:Rieske Fe-S protein